MIIICINVLNTLLDDEYESSHNPVFVVLLLYCRIVVGLFPKKVVSEYQMLSSWCQGHFRVMLPYYDFCHHYKSGLCQSHIRVMSGLCQGHVRVMSGSCQGHVRVKSGSSQGNVRVMLGLCQGHVRDISGSCQGDFRVLSWSSLCHVRLLSR